MRSRVTFAILLAVALIAAIVIAIIYIPKQVPTQTYWPTRGWRSSTPEEQGFDSGKLADGLRTMRDRKIQIDSLLIIRNGYVVLDAYFHPYDGSIPHKLASVTKSFTTTLIGIAIDQGIIQPDQPVLSFFPDRTIANLDDRKELVTVQHLASMRNGFRSGCLSGDEATLNEMRSNPDWVQAALDREMVNTPGTSFCYDSPGMHLLSAILQGATGMTALDYARQNLFEPLGIQEVLWRADPQGYTRGWGDLYLKPPDAAKLGYLWLNRGVWDGQQVISAGWVENSVLENNPVGADTYGYGWWVSDDNYFAMGRGGQYIKVFPAYDIIVVTTARGIDFDQITPFLVEAFVDPEKPLPANPGGVDELNQVLAELAQDPEAWPVGVVQNVADVVTGKTYVFEPNAIDLKALRLESSNAAETSLYLRLEGEDATWPVGLDGKYRLASTGQGLRGYWADSQTLNIEIFENGIQPLQLYFEAERVEVRLPERGLSLEGRVEN